MHSPFLIPASRTDTPITRRSLLRGTACGALSLTVAAHLAEGPSALHAADTPAMPPLNRFPRMMQRYFLDRVRQIEQKAMEERAALKTKADAEAYVQRVREKIRLSFGPFPEKTPLNARITGVVERDAYRVEKVIFDSRPNFPVTGNLYVPKDRKLPLPGVVGTCGHSSNGKAYEGYQSFAQGLARMGYVVLIYDPIGQGERLQYPDDKLKSRIGVGVREHLYAGNQQFLVGDFLGTWRAWDGVRALDYLLTRKEVDPKQLGVTGNSGGGTMTTWLCGVEHRWTMAAPSCFVTMFRRNLENELPADTEQCPPRALALGLEHEDFLAALAPQPVIILAKERDYFDVRGSEEALGRLKRLYGLLGAEENIGLFVGPTHHGYSQENREAMYRWFNRATEISAARNEPEITVEKDETLWCTPRGQIVDLKPRTVFSLTREKSQILAKQRGRLSGRELADAIASVVKLPPRDGAPPYRILRNIRSRNYPRKHSVTYAVQTEKNIEALVYRLMDERHMSRPPRGPDRALLYVAHLSSDAELRDEPFVAELIDQESAAAVYTCDVRGIGESQPNTCGENQFFSAYGSDYFYAIHAIMLDYPYVGQKTHDVLRVLDWLKAVGHKQVHLAAKGWGAIPATFAAVLSDAVVQVTLKNALTSYTDIAESEDYRWPLSALLPDVLGRFDLTDCYAELATHKNLRQIAPWNAMAEGR